MEYKTRQWHEKCFCCVVCKNPIGTKSFIPREQEIYCAGCYEDKFATRCIKCNKVSQHLEYSSCAQNTKIVDLTYFHVIPDRLSPAAAWRTRTNPGTGIVLLAAIAITRWRDNVSRLATTSLTAPNASANSSQRDAPHARSRSPVSIPFFQHSSRWILEGQALFLGKKLMYLR